MLEQRRKDEQEKQAKKFGARKEGQVRSDAQVRAVMEIAAGGDEKAVERKKAAVTEVEAHA